MSEEIKANPNAELNDEDLNAISGGAGGDQTQQVLNPLNPNNPINVFNPLNPLNPSNLQADPPGETSK